MSVDATAPRLGIVSSEVSVGALRGHYAHPPGDGPFPGVVLLDDMLGLGPDMRGMVDLLAHHGYATIAPDLYSAGARPLCVARTVVDMARGGGATVHRLGQVRGWLADRPEVDGQRLGVVGYCMGGRFALATAARHDFTVAAVNYGPVPAEAKALSGICPVVASYGDLDRVFASHAQRLRKHLQGLGVRYDIRVYPGVGHSFLSPTPVPWWATPASLLLHLTYDEPAARDAWQRIFAFFDDQFAEAEKDAGDG